MSACSDSGSLKVLERTATASDELPEDVKLNDVKLDKALLVAEANGKKYFVGQGNEGPHACLITVPTDGSGWYSGCTDATKGELVKTGGPDQESSILVADGYDTKELEASGWTKIHENVLVSDG